jgi:K+-sensing histidine kinase KdpD
MYNPNHVDRQGLAMLEREQREDQTDRLVILPTTARGHSGCGDQERFAGRIMKSPREVLVRSIALSLAAILLTTVLVAEAYSHATALHIRDPEDLALAFLLPTIFIAVFFGSTFAVASSFVSGLAAAYVIYPPEASIWIHDPNHVAELGFILLLAITASKAVGIIIDGKPLGSSGASAASRRM